MHHCGRKPGAEGEFSSMKEKGYGNRDKLEKKGPAGKEKVPEGKSAYLQPRLEGKPSERRVRCSEDQRGVASWVV